MRIEELTAELPITLIANISNEQLAFDTEVVEVYPRKRFILAKALYHDGKVISFRGTNLIVDLLVCTEENKPQLFKNVTITVVKKTDNTIYYSITTIAESKPYNRRKNFRCYIGLGTSIQAGANHAAHDAIIRDISSSGFSVVCGKDVILEKQQVIHALLRDNFEETGERIAYDLYGIITRIQELPNGHIVYGCRLNKAVYGLDAYIMKKERLRLKKLNGGIL